MKIYLVMGKAKTQKEYTVIDEPLAAFSTENNAKNYILKTWPEVHKESNDLYGVYYTFGPTEDFTWKAIYTIKEMEIEDL